MVEVMMALAVLAAGATGIVAMQKATAVANTRSRNLSTASQIAATWIDRLKLDALQWRLLANGGTTLASTRWLNTVAQDFPTVAGFEGRWIRPQVDAAMGYSPSADVRGVDDTAKPENGPYCTHLSMLQMMPNMIRVSVRVFWLRGQGVGVSQNYAGTVNGQPLCSTDQGYIDQVGKETGRYHFVYMTDAVMQNGALL